MKGIITQLRFGCYSQDLLMRRVVGGGGVLGLEGDCFSLELKFPQQVVGEFLRFIQSLFMAELKLGGNNGSVTVN